MAGTESTPNLSEMLRKVMSNATPVDPLTEQQILDAQADRALKKSYANWFIWILIGQLVVMNVAFFFVGFSLMKFDEWVLNLYMGGTLAEVFGVIFVITNNLFPKKS